MTNSSFTSWIRNLPEVQILVVGDVMVDRYVWGDVDRISPEAPIPVVDCRRIEDRPGAGANVAQNVVAMGGQVRILSVAGDDRAGDILTEALTANGVNTDQLIQLEDRQTPVKKRMIARGQQMLRLDQEDTHPISRNHQDQLLEALQERLDETDVVLVCDYKKGTMPTRFLDILFETCREAEVPTIVDPKGSDYTRYRNAYAITPNKDEAEQATGIQIEQDRDFQHAAEALFAEGLFEYVIITRGPEGMSLFSKEGKKLHVPAETIEVFDVTGAGDTVVAAMGIGMTVEGPTERTLQLANLAGARAVEEVGNIVVSREDLLDALEQQKGVWKEKIFELDDLLAELESRRKGDRTVVFTNGCFDLLHSGHLRTLQFAADQGSHLVVGLNSDESIREIKGDERPVLPEQERLELVAALEMVDAVILFDEPTPEALIKQIVPDVLVKGEEYRDEKVVGQETVTADGGRVAYAPMVDGISTTSIIDEITGNES